MKNCCICLIVLKFFSLVKAQQYMNLTRSSEYASLEKAFNLTCRILKPQELSTDYVFFKRNFSTKCVGIGHVNGVCRIDSYVSKYTYKCLSENIFSLTIPAENMTEDEQNSEWHCESIVNSSYRSSSIFLKIAIQIHNISISPNDNPFTIRESEMEDFKCVVNRNALPAPTIVWYLGSKKINSTASRYTSSITITGNRASNTETLMCEATNNHSSMTAHTTLNVEYPPLVDIFSEEHDIIEGRNLTITCTATPGNPSSTTFYWEKVNKKEFRQNGTSLKLPQIQRTDAGIYRCTAENRYKNGEIGTHNQSLVIKVLYPPGVKIQYSQQDTEEGKDISANCSVTPGYPEFTTVFWTKVNNSAFRQNGSIFQLINIQRTSSGHYLCKAENKYPGGGKGSDNQTMIINVQYPPSVYNLSQKNIIEGGNILVECKAKTGNPRPTTYFWTKVNISSFRQNGTTLSLPNIRRNSSGTYRCTAENTYNDGKKRNHSQTMVINVLYHPSIEMKSPKIVNESEKVTLTRVIDSNPLSIVMWYWKGMLLKTENMPIRNIASYTIEEAKCYDTKNFTIIASNGVEKNATDLVELRVNCKPMPARKLITLGVTDNTGIQFSTTVIAYPKPTYNLERNNGSTSNHLINSITMNAVNNFTINYNQTDVDQKDYGIYYLTVRNEFGNATVVVNVIPQKRPDVPRNITVICDEEGAKVQWMSSFNGGEDQTFIIRVFNSQKVTGYFKRIPDKGEDIIHTSYVNNLQPSELYVFFVYAENGHGNSSSEEMTCTTLKKDAVNRLPLIVGVAAAGGITFGIIVIVIFLFFRRYVNNDKQAKKAQRLTEEDQSEVADDDGLKDNILYVSADPKVDEKPETSVYAAVNKRVPESKSNANVYAEVNKGRQITAQEGALYSDVKVKKGFFKKDGSRKKDGIPKQKKGKKERSKQDVADVYENSEGIAMTANVDDVYSNSEHKNQTETEQRGYKNKDGLLYVEVNFGGKQGQDNPVIHGEDEKTDYATVEFPMSSALHKASGSEAL